MKNLLRILFVLLLARPLVRLWLGITVRHQRRLPLTGPAIVVANHNSHLDILTLFSLFPLSVLPNVHPAAAADYFLTNRRLAWFATHVIGIIPVIRGGAGSGHDPLAACRAALKQGKILILFPEGTRGEPENMSEIKAGIWHLLREMPEVPVVPVYLHGLGRAMGKGQRLPVPFFVDIGVGRPLYWQSEKDLFRAQIRAALLQLRDKIRPVMSPEPASALEPEVPLSIELKCSARSVGATEE
ncbi:1-acyl-sn-glycerol-3-phosphate acyltransferase [Plesiomonas shigelloides]|uniref:lysophospholipid acyltransferase family protein n=1 Tax=Plesiomonas shigelloides TaxID=703 RepID=UPI0012625E3F|nr:lysophospholipid acyltransferase family protein [Plesiomonas shigelloides]KAB7694589.1 1-acyl-sn-glycerol-3-phosphate acyltransferase [Plesiomonas shigelloides]